MSILAFKVKKKKAVYSATGRKEYSTDTTWMNLENRGKVTRYKRSYVI